MAIFRGKCLFIENSKDERGRTGKGRISTQEKQRLGNEIKKICKENGVRKAAHGGKGGAVEFVAAQTRAGQSQKYLLCIHSTVIRANVECRPTKFDSSLRGGDDVNPSVKKLSFKVGTISRRRGGGGNYQQRAEIARGGAGAGGKNSGRTEKMKEKSRCEDRDIDGLILRWDKGCQREKDLNRTRELNGKRKWPAERLQGSRDGEQSVRRDPIGGF